MNEVMKKRAIGAVVLVIIGIALPLMLVRCLQGGNEQDTMRVYDVAPDGQTQPAEGRESADARQSVGNGEYGDVDETSAPERRQMPEAISPASEAVASSGSSSASASAAEAESTPAAESEPEPMPDTPSVQSESQASPAQSPTQGQAQTSSTPASDSSLRRRGSISGWVVQVASFRDESNAERLAGQLNSDFSAFYRSGDVNGTTYYRVRVGPFDSERSARAAAARLRELGRATLVQRAE